MSNQVILTYAGNTPDFLPERTFTFQGERCFEMQNGKFVGSGPRDTAQFRILDAVCKGYTIHEESVSVVREHCPECAERIIQALGINEPPLIKIAIAGTSDNTLAQKIRDQIRDLKVKGARSKVLIIQVAAEDPIKPNIPFEKPPDFEGF